MRHLCKFVMSLPGNVSEHCRISQMLSGIHLSLSTLFQTDLFDQSKYIQLRLTEMFLQL